MSENSIKKNLRTETECNNRNNLELSEEFLTQKRQKSKIMTEILDMIDSKKDLITSKKIQNHLKLMGIIASTKKIRKISKEDCCLIWKRARATEAYVNTPKNIILR